MRDFTESYCERCGTRYTFGPTPSKRPSLAGARVLAKGLKNFVMSDETSMDEAMAAARIDVDRGESSRVTEEFHRTFNFCMPCRQYACDKCWNPNQGACLSCAPLRDYEPVALETPDGTARTTQPTADAGLGDASAEAVPWPSEDPLPGRPEPRRNGQHAAESTISDPEATPRTQPAQPNQQPQIVRSADREQQAAQELQAQSQSWKSLDDGWTLWPAAEGAEGTVLTPEELMLVQAQLSYPSPYEEPDFPDAPPDVPPDVPPDAPKTEAFSPSHTLDEDAARMTPQEPRRRADPETPAPGAWEPEAPAARTAPPSDFDLLGSLREPIEFTEPAAPAEPHRAPVIGRLLGRHTPIAGPAQQQGPKAPKILKAPKPAKASEPRSAGQASPWPQVTPWVQRPIERHDWWADSDAAPLKEVEAVEPASEPVAQSEQVAFAAPSPAVAEPEPTLAGQAHEPVPAPATPAQQPLFTMPPATAERWPAIKSAEAPAPWPPIGASWPTQDAPAALWPGPDPALVSASVAAAHQADQGESPLVAAIWAESAQEVLRQGSVRVCHRCALPVSTQARFCRRCGTQQT